MEPQDMEMGAPHQQIPLCQYGEQHSVGNQGPRFSFYPPEAPKVQMAVGRAEDLHQRKLPQSSGLRLLTGR